MEVKNMANCKVGSIREVHQRLQAEGYNVSEYRLRLWVRQGILHAVHAGKKLLISFDNVVALLEGDLAPSTPA